MINILWSHVPVIFLRHWQRSDIVQTTASFARVHRFFSSILLTTSTRFSILLVSQANERRFNLCRDREISNVLLENDSSSFLLIGISRISFSFLRYPGFFDRVFTTARSICEKHWMEYYFDKRQRRQFCELTSYRERIYLFIIWNIFNWSLD